MLQFIKEKNKKILLFIILNATVTKQNKIKKMVLNRLLLYFIKKALISTIRRHKMIRLKTFFEF